MSKLLSLICVASGLLLAAPVRGTVISVFLITEITAGVDTSKANIELFMSYNNTNGFTYPEDSVEIVCDYSGALVVGQNTLSIDTAEVFVSEVEINDTLTSVGESVTTILGVTEFTLSDPTDEITNITCTLAVNGTIVHTAVVTSDVTGAGLFDVYSSPFYLTGNCSDYEAGNTSALVSAPTNASDSGRVNAEFVACAADLAATVAPDVPDDNDGLDGPAIAGIVIGSLAAVLFIGLLVYYNFHAKEGPQEKQYKEKVKYSKIADIETWGSSSYLS